MSCPLWNKWDASSESLHQVHQRYVTPLADCPTILINLIGPITAVVRMLCQPARKRKMGLKFMMLS